MIWVILLFAPVLWYGITTWTLRRYASSETRELLWLWPAQLTVLAIGTVFVMAALFPNEMHAVTLIVTFIFPPLAGLVMAFDPFLGAVVAPIGLAAFIGAALIAKARGFAPIYAVAAMVSAAALFGGTFYDRQMCASAAHLGLTDIQRPPFLYNVWRARSKHGRAPYAIAQKDDEIWDWGYARPAFVKYRGEITASADLSRFTALNCPVF